MLARTQSARRRNFFIFNNTRGERRRKTIGSLSERLHLVGAVGQRLGQVRKMDDEAPLLVGFEPNRIAVRRSGHRGAAFLF